MTMMIVVRWLLILALPFLLACKEGQKNPSASEAPIASSSVQVLDYTSSVASVDVSGDLTDDAVQDLDFIEIYTNSACTGAFVGKTTVLQFKTTGINLSLPVDEGELELYMSTTASDDCLRFGDFDPDDLQPEDPTLDRFSPVSPSNVTFQPGVYGNAYPSASNVAFYDDSSCTNMVGGGTTADYSSIGLQLTLTANALSTVYGKTVDPLGNESSCVELGEYRHANTVLGNPTFLSVSPLSPNNATNEPQVRGQAPPFTDVIGLYSDAGCLALLNEGDPTDFSTAGFIVTISANTSTGIYAQARDTLNNKSICTLMTTYEYDTIGPADPTFTAASPISPTNQTTAPVLTGTAPVDSLTTSFYDSNLCLVYCWKIAAFICNS